ncbi:MAG TPA: hypothetical protein VG900_04050 [Hyphomicrobiaceae bacterium]|jgi:hypothetical protein|nr:hypothetical protein [Hyphomicrobiaceae bacterium]
MTNHMRVRSLAVLLTTALLAFRPAPLLAGPIADYDSAFRTAYADYRNALFATNANNRDGSEKALSAFEAKWSMLTRKYLATPPPQYSEDPRWSESLAAATAIVERAKAEVGNGALAQAHEILESLRAVFSDMRERNGLIAYSDRIDAFHHAMEQVLTKSYGGFAGDGLIDLTEDVSVLAFLGAELRKAPPPDAAVASDFEPLVEALNKTVADLRATVRTGDVPRIKDMRMKLKPAFAKLFVKFG